MSLHLSKKLLHTLIIITFIDFIIQPILFAEDIKRDNFIFKQKKFISELYNDKKYFDCISETRRLLYYYPNIPGYNEYTYFVEGNYFLGKQYKTVINHLKGSPKYNNLRLPFLILLSQSYLGIRLYNESIRTLKQINYSDIENAQKFNLFIRRTEIYLSNSEYENALSEIKGSKKYIMKKNKDLIILEHEIRQYREIGLRSKWLSVAFSTLFPGSGQIYSGRHIDGIISFITIATTAFGAYHCYDKGKKSISITLGFFLSLFYAGNLYGAYNSAEKTNSQKNNNFRLKLLDKYVQDYHPNDYIDIDKILN